MAHWDSENFSTKVPPDNILCTTCKFQMPSIKINGKTVSRANYGTCSRYVLKPQDVLWSGAYCPNYRKK